MTPAEAREIDRLEFEAECAAIRQRAYALVRQPATPPARALPMSRPVSLSAADALGDGRHYRPRHLPPAPPPPSARYYTAFGKTLTLSGWAIESGLSAFTIRSRLTYGWSVERAVTERPSSRRRHRRRRGVVSNFPPASGTGAGSTAQETPEITFSEEANS